MFNFQIFNRINILKSVEFVGFFFLQISSTICRPVNFAFFLLLPSTKKERNRERWKSSYKHKKWKNKFSCEIKNRWTYIYINGKNWNFITEDWKNKENKGKQLLALTVNIKHKRHDDWGKNKNHCWIIHQRSLIWWIWLSISVFCWQEISDRKGCLF